MSDFPGFKILGIDHLGLAPKDPKQNIDFFKLLSLPFVSEETVRQQNVHTTIFASETIKNTSNLSLLEILEPTSDESSIRKFLDKRGSGIHHIALRVDHIKNAIDYLLKNNIQLITEKPQMGVHQTLVVFVHPKSTGGILVELVEHV